MGPAGRTTIQARVDRIYVPPGRRPIDEAHVANLMVSFQEIGQRNAIELVALEDDHPERGSYAWKLNAGGHRLEAGRRLGWRVLDAIVADDDALVTRIAEVDENLIRRDYTALERAQALAARLEAWAAKHPERAHATADGTLKAKRGRPAKLDHHDPFPGAPTMGFAEEAASKVGLSVPTIKRDLALYRGIPAGLQEKLQGTWVASNPGALRQLASIGEPVEQAAVAAVLLRGETKSVSDARAIAAGKTPMKAAQSRVDETLKAFRSLWARGPSHRDAILNYIEGQPLPKGWAAPARRDV